MAHYKRERMKENEFTTIAITKQTKNKLDELKVHEREPYEDVIKRLMEKAKKRKS